MSVRRFRTDPCSAEEMVRLLDSWHAGVLNIWRHDADSNCRTRVVYGVRSDRNADDMRARCRRLLLYAWFRGIEQRERERLQRENLPRWSL